MGSLCQNNGSMGGRAGVSILTQAVSATGLGFGLAKFVQIAGVPTAAFRRRGRRGPPAINCWATCLRSTLHPAVISVAGCSAGLDGSQFLLLRFLLDRSYFIREK